MCGERKPELRLLATAAAAALALMGIIFWRELNYYPKEGPNNNK